MTTTYTREEDNFLITHYDDYSWEQLTELLNSTFGTSRKFRSVKSHCRTTLGLKKVKNPHEYGQTPSCEIGTEKWENGYLWVKVNNVRRSRTNRSASENWIQKHRLVWMQHNGTIPDQHQIVFLDGNHTNFDVNNLYCIDLRVMTRMARNHWFTSDPTLTLTAIKLCELYLALNERRTNE